MTLSLRNNIIHNSENAVIEKFFENSPDAFCLYTLYTHEDGKEDLLCLAANKAFLEIISKTSDKITGKLFSESCSTALDWLPMFIITAKTGESKHHESYYQTLNKFLCATTFSPKIGQVALIIYDRTTLWNAEQDIRIRDKDISALFYSMTTGFCIGKIIRNEAGVPVDVYFDMVNAAFELLEGFPAATLTGKKLSQIRTNYEYFSKYVEVVENKSKITFIKYIDLNNFTLEAICFSQSDDMFICIQNNISKRVKAEKTLMQAYQTIENQNKTILSSMDYASKIQKNLLPLENVFKEAFLDYSVIWSPRDIVGGDIYWLKNFPEGSLLCVCDCTGHGTPGALLTTLVVSALDTIVNDVNYQNTAQILWELDIKIDSILNVQHDKSITDKNSSLSFNDGCDIAILFISKLGTVSISSSNINVFICNGENVTKIKGQRLMIGEGKLKSCDNIKTTMIPYNTDNKYYISTDGLFHQVGRYPNSNKPLSLFGYKIFMQLVLTHHYKTQKEITDIIWQEFEKYMGKQTRRDDIQLITFRTK